jgi:hypothetical protein
VNHHLALLPKLGRASVGEWFCSDRNNWLCRSAPFLLHDNRIQRDQRCASAASRSKSARR